MRQKGQGCTMRQGTVPLIFHWLLLFDIDSTEKLRVNCQTERWEVYLCMYVCVKVARSSLGGG